MKILALFLVLFSVSANAGDMLGANFGFGQNTTPFYGVDYEFNQDLPYLDVALFANKQYVQPYVSVGLQFEHINVGFAGAISMSGYSAGAFQGQLTFGPEIGYMQNLSKSIYVKENNSYMGYGGQYSLTSTLSLGLNL